MNEKLILGTVQFGLNYGINNTTGKTDKKEITEILDFAFTNGVKTLDTAEVYGDAQAIIGDYHRISKNKFDVITKFSCPPNLDSKFSISDHVYNNLNVLQISSIYGYMFHSFFDYEKYYEIFENDLLQLKNSGVIQKIGVSVYTNQELISVIENSEIELIQIPFNLFDNHIQRSTALNKAKEKGVEIHTRSVFLQGLFFKDVNTISGNLIEIKNDLFEIKNLLKQQKIEMVRCALNYPLSKKYIDKVLIGVDSLQQLKQNIKTINSLEGLEAIYTDVDRLEIINKELLNPSLWKM